MSDGQSSGEQTGETLAMSGEQKVKAEPMLFADFLMKVGSSQWRSIADLVYRDNTLIRLASPEISLPCDDARCGGLRTFRFAAGDTYFQKQTVLDTFLTYLCSNCEQTTKRFALQTIRSVKATEVENGGRAYKYGESPQFGPSTPSRLLRLFGSDKDIFLKGRRCEAHGLGIGAFVYYRRVVESHKKQIFDEIIRVSETVGLAPDKLQVIREARNETQFSKSMVAVKDALPQTLLVKGQNPLTLLHRALSSHLHERSDQECLELAHAVRIVLIELAEKMSAALNDEAELNDAVAKLMKAQT